MSGQIVCRVHGGKQPGALRNAKDRQVMAEVNNLLMSKIANFNPDDVESAEEGLLREVLWSGQIAMVLGELVGNLNDVDMTARGMGGSVQLNLLVQWWNEERINHAKLCKLALDAGIAQRQLDLLESQAGQIVTVIVAVLQSPKLGLTTEQITEGRIAAAEVLRALPRGVPA